MFPLPQLGVEEGQAWYPLTALPTSQEKEEEEGISQESSEEEQ